MAAPTHKPAVDDIYLFGAGEQTGPHTLAELRARFQTGNLPSDALGWWGDVQEWRSLHELPGLMGPVSPVPLLPPEVPSSQPSELTELAGVPSPTSPPPRPVGHTKAALRFNDYRLVPWYRKSSINSALILLGLLSCGWIPGALAVCIVVLTGDVYYNQRDSTGNLRVWSGGNKVAAVALLALTMFFLFSHFSSPDSPTGGPSSGEGFGGKKQVENSLAAALRDELNIDKQQIFERIHPLGGNAKSAQVHEVTVNSWKRGVPSNRPEDVQQFTVRYTLYWEGPLITDGYTKISQTWDNETQRWVGGYQILETNGMTNKDASEAVGTVLGTWLQYQAQKSGAEQATRDYLNNR